MADDDDDFGGFVTPADKALEGVANVVKLVLASTAIVIGWLGATGIALLYALTSTDGTYAQGLAINLLSSLVLVALAPFLIDMIATKRKTFWLIAAVTAGVLFGAYMADKGLRDFLLNFGSGLCLLLGVDYFVSRRFQDWTKRMEERVQKMGKMPSHPVLF
jgi:hypothetical protein